MTEKELAELIVEYGNACFDCGAWTGDEPDSEPYNTLSDRAQELKLRLIAEYRAERELLKKYGDHMVTCAVRQWNDLTEVCDCGWRKLTFD